MMSLSKQVLSRQCGRRHADAAEYMSEFFLKTGDEITGPLTAEELKDGGGVAPQAVVRHGLRGRWNHLTEVLWKEGDAVEALEEGLDPGEGLEVRRHRRKIRGFSVIVLFLVVGTLWVIVDALSMRS